MPNTQPPPIPPQARAGYAERRMWGKLGAFTLMLVPIPAALLLMLANDEVGSQLFGDLRSDRPGFYSAIGFALFATLTCLFGAIKLLGGFEKGGWRILGGVGLGLMFLLFDWAAVFLAACAVGPSDWL